MDISSNISNPSIGTIAYYTPDIISYIHYLPFGQVMPNRHKDDNSYRYGYQGSEKDMEVKGEGNSYTTEFRQLDPRVGRWLSPDPLEDEMEDLSPYNSMGNNPIQFNDPDGDCPWCVTALIGGLIEGGLELGGQMLSGKSLSDVDWADVSVEFTKGAITGSGAGLVTRVTADVAGAVVKSTVDVSKKGGVKTVGNGKSVKAAAVDLTLDVVGDKVAGAGTAKLVKKTNSAVKSSTKKAVVAGKKITQTANKANKAAGKHGANSSQAIAAKKIAKEAVVKSNNANGKKAMTKMVQKVTPNASKVVGEAITNKAIDKTIEKVDGK